MKTLREVIVTEFKKAGADVKDQKVEIVISNLNQIFESEWNRIEIKCRVHEIEQALTMKNKVLVGETILPDFQNRGMIDPKIMQLRMQGLKKTLRKKK